MVVALQTRARRTREQVRAFVDTSDALGTEARQREAAYAFVAETLAQFGYTRLAKTDKGLIVRYLCRITGRSHQRVTRLIPQYHRTGTGGARRGPTV